MTRILEKRIEKKLRQKMIAIDGACYKFVSPVNNGVPDRICIFPDGQLVFVELKKPRDGQLSKIQQYQIRRLQKLKQRVYVIWTLGDIDKFFKDFGYGKI